MDNVFTYTYTITTTYHADTEWDNQQNLLCTHANAKANAVEDAQLKINVPFIKLALAKEWGPYVKFQWNQTLKDSCVNTSASMWKCGKILGMPVCIPGQGGTLSFDDCHSQCQKKK